MKKDISFLISQQWPAQFESVIHKKGNFIIMLVLSNTHTIQQSIWRAIFWFMEYSLSILPSNTIHQSIWGAISWFMELFVSPPTQYSSLYGGQYPAEWNNYQYNSLSYSPAHCKFWLQGKVRSSVKSCYGSTLMGQSTVKIRLTFFTVNVQLCQIN